MSRCHALLAIGKLLRLSPISIDLFQITKSARHPPIYRSASRKQQRRRCLGRHVRSQFAAQRGLEYHEDSYISGQNNF